MRMMTAIVRVCTLLAAFGCNQGDDSGDWPHSAGRQNHGKAGNIPS
jgi:hypothetical protein